MVDHIEIYVSHLIKSREFYDLLLPKLGYRLYQEWSVGFSYRKDEHYVVFVQVAEKYASIPYHRCHVGLNHLAFNGGSRRYVERLKKILQEHDVPLLYEERYPFAGGENHFALYIEDPDRIKIEVIANENIRNL
ncbi:VOC family protein [Streptococcus orisratti]|uniref:VOC family protein n=1 Tax=Streptococcus orisratti TaxID=114652 RepID=UPI003D07726F